MGGSTKLMSSGAGGVILTTPGSIAADVTVNLPVTGVNNGTLVCSNSSGNVGIGTSSPTSALTVISPAGGANGIVLGTDASTSALSNRLFFTNATSAQGYAIVNNGGALAFQYGAIPASSSGTEAMRIDSSGNLLVGTTALQGAGGWTLYPTGSAGAPLAVWNRANTANSTTALNFLNNGSAVGYIAYNNTATTYSTSSDYRLKENIQPMQNALGVVAQLNPVTYTWKADGSDGQGFIAHELQAVVPDCVTGEKDAVDEEGKPVYQGIDTSFLVATLTKAIQELTARVEQLEAK